MNSEGYGSCFVTVCVYQQFLTLAAASFGFTLRKRIRTTFLYAFLGF